jgi:hypothetical protein
MDSYPGSPKCVRGVPGLETPTPPMFAPQSPTYECGQPAPWTPHSPRRRFLFDAQDLARRGRGPTLAELHDGLQPEVVDLTGDDAMEEIDLTGSDDGDAEVIDLTGSDDGGAGPSEMELDEAVESACALLDAFAARF